MRVGLRCILLMAACILLMGCGGGGYSADPAISRMMAMGDTSYARVDLARRADDPSQPRERLLYNQQAMHAALLDGLPEAAGRRVEYVYDTLRTQGLNEANRADSFFVNEQGVRVWKGEPYEQAMALCLIAVADMSTGRWGNARAAAIESLSRLESGGSGTGSEFVFGRLLAGVANQELGRQQEAEEHFTAALKSDTRIRALVDELRSRRHNALFVVEYGRSPTKVAVGTDGTQVGFRARTVSDSKGLRVSDGAGVATWPWVADVNDMSADFRWTGLDASRRSKSTAGSLLTAGGVGVAASSDDLAVQAAGLGAAAVGMIAKANARADTRYNDLLPQRVYLAPVRIGQEPPTLMLEGSALTSFRPLGLRPSESGLAVQLVRLSEGSHGAWAQSGRVYYANDVTGALSEPTLPWILGGRCVRTPSRTLMREYHAAGLPHDVTYERLMQLYHAEGIDILSGQDQNAARGHILERGSTLFTPQGGTVGFTRLFGSWHAPYSPISSEVKALIEHMKNTPSSMENES